MSGPMSIGAPPDGQGVPDRPPDAAQGDSWRSWGIAARAAAPWLPAAAIPAAYLAAARLMPDNGYIPPPIAAGFAMTIVIAVIYGVILWRQEGRTDDHEERLHALERLVSGWLPGEVDDVECVTGWPEEEHDPVEPPTTPIPVVRPDEHTSPMELGDHIEADVRAHVVREAEVGIVEREVGGYVFRVREPAP